MSGKDLVNTYLINIVLPNNVEVANLRVSEGKLIGKANVLIGMDIITRGDFAVTNFRGKTVFSFQMPSIGHIDFTQRLTIAPHPEPKRESPHVSTPASKRRGKKK